MKRKVTVKIPRIIILMGGILFFLIVIKLSFVALSSNVDGVNLHEFANNRNTKKDIIYAKRGNIYDKDGNTLATTVNSYKIIAYLDPKRTTNPKKPYHVVDKEMTAKALAEALKDKGMTYEYALERLNKEGAYQVEFGKYGSDINESKKNKIEELKLPGIDFIDGIKRTYNMGTYASYIIGYAKIKDNGEINGELGIESYYNDDLKGKNGSLTYQTDAYGYTLPSANIIKEDSTDGNSIYLTLDSNIQLFAENLTKNLSKNHKMDWMIFTVMDAHTGAIVASSTYPNFDPNSLSTIKSYNNPLISYEYEPGSTMKIFSFATAIEEGKYDGNATFASGHKEIADVVISDHNKVGWGTITYDTGFAYSSNVAASNLGLSLGADKLSSYYKRLGFGSKTNMELANEVKGKINFKYITEIATASFGQGITVTPVQMLQAMSAFSNGGVTIKPYIVDKIVNDKGEVIFKQERQELEKVYSKETVEYMHKLMHNVVYDGMSDYWQPEKTKLIGKTGTAQIAEHGKYLKGQTDYIRSFLGMFPEEDPKYIIYVAVKQMDTTSARPIANEVTKAIDDIVSYLGIENTVLDSNSKIVKLGNYLSKEIKVVKEELTKSKIKVYTLGSGKYIVNQYPLKNSKVILNSKVFLVSNKDDYKMEDLTNWSLNEVQTYCNLLGIKLKFNGSGYVINQSIKANTEITSDMELEIELNK